MCVSAEPPALARMIIKCVSRNNGVITSMSDRWHGSQGVPDRDDIGPGQCFLFRIFQIETFFDLKKSKKPYT